jgi:sterol desaturase/sphingolipid hydroxylase (fatty acid hydroxylase superfamily)
VQLFLRFWARWDNYLVVLLESERLPLAIGTVFILLWYEYKSFFTHGFIHRNKVVPIKFVMGSCMFLCYPNSKIRR